MNEQRWQQLNSQVEELYHRGKFREGITIAEEALDLARSLWGSSHLNFAISLQNLAGVYYSQGRYTEAEPLFVEALELYKKLLGEEHPQVAASTNNLALLYYSQGGYGKAEPLLVEALELYKKLPAPSDPQVATITNNLAALYYFQGRYGEAKAWYIDALKLTKELLGEEHPDIVRNSNNLAELYRSQGRYGEAEPLFVEALALRKKLLGEEHPLVARSTNNLAGLYYSQGRYEKAEPLYLEALALTKKLLGEEHPDVAAITNNLAELYRSQGRYGEAEPLFVEALALTKQLLGRSHPQVASSTNNLAQLYKSQGRYEEAEPLLIDALALTKQLLGTSHPHVATSAMNLALLLAATHRPAEALELMTEATAVEERLIRRTFATSAERDRLAYLQNIRYRLEMLLSLVRDYLWDSPAAVATALDLVLKRKCLSASALAAFNEALYSDRYPELKEDFQQWRQLNEEIIELIFSPPEPKPETTGEQFRQELLNHQQRLSDLEAQSDKLERWLASRVPEIQLQEESDCLAVASELPEDSALLEFVQFRVYDFPEDRWQPPRYLAFVLPGGQPDRVRAVDLGDAEHIDRLIATFRQGLCKPTSTLGARPKNKDKTSKLAGVELRQAIFSDELRQAVEGYRRLLLVPDGDLNLVPFQVLPAGDGGQRRLIDEYALSYLSAGRDLLRRKFRTNRPASEPLILADPDFDWGLPELPSTVADAAGNATLELGKEPLLASLGGNNRFERAIGTDYLGVRVGKMLGVKPYLQRNASELHLTNGNCPRVLLLATHGEFLTRDRQQEYMKLNQELWNGGNEKTQKSRTDKESNRWAAANLENPMLRSAIALAGANTWLSGRPLPPEAGNKGIVSAQDIARLDLWGCQLAVLSACQTGLGDIRTGEGVFGMRRAFAVAGTETLIVSLWSVPARATALLMERFFANLGRGLGRGEALQVAQNYLRTVTVEELEKDNLGRDVLEELRSDPALKTFLAEPQPLAHPYFWGAWACQGDTRGFEL